MVDEERDPWEERGKLEEGVDYVERDGEYFDVKEIDPKYRNIIKKVDKEVEENIESKFPGMSKTMGFCHSFWNEKKRILKEKYGIDWRSPSELNPGTLYD